VPFPDHRLAQVALARGHAGDRAPVAVDVALLDGHRLVVGDQRRERLARGVSPGLAVLGGADLGQSHRHNPHAVRDRQHVAVLHLDHAAGPGRGALLHRPAGG
jgi:hypothetical protein